MFTLSNILISAALFPGSMPYKAFVKAVTDPYDAIICDQNVDELKRIFKKKFPKKMPVLETFLSIIMTSMTIAMVPEEPVEDEKKIRDEKDRPISRAAVASGADLFSS